VLSLTIEDGNPWYLSPNIWTVPGSDPLGAEGLPVAGRPCYLWARVRNLGNARAENATVRFYWANPSVGVTRSTATLVGSSFVTLDPGDTGDVLCLMPWVPAWVNQGHECVLAEAFHPLDPVPTTVDFAVPTDRHVAQRNLSVLQVAQQMFSMQMEVHNPAPARRRFRLLVRPGEKEQLRPFARLMERMGATPREDGALARVGFTNQVCPDEAAAERAEDKIELELGPGERTGVTVVGALKGESAVIHVTQEDGETVTGGLAVLIMRGGKGS
jgi:hypothetical protein